jgi:hypothetical protein
MICRPCTPASWHEADLAAAIVSQHLEKALIRRFGIGWVARDDGHGFEIKASAAR